MKKVKSLIIIISLFFNSGCLTRSVWSKSYGDGIKSFLISKNGEEVIFLGEKYHYILDDKSKVIQKLLAWDSKHKLKAIIRSFYVSRTNSVKVNISIEKSKTDLTRDEIRFLRSLGFVELNFREKALYKNIILSGKRYVPNAKMDYNSISLPLSNRYHAHVEYDDFLNDLERAIVTPVAIVIDGAVISLAVSGGAIFTVINAPFFYASCMKDQINCNN